MTSTPPTPTVESSGQSPHSESLGGRTLAILRAHRALGAVLGAYAVTALVVPVMTPAAVNDDWIWTRSVEILVAEGRLEILEISAPFALFQIFWGAMFAAVIDNAFGALRVATVTFVGLTSVGVYALCRQLRLPPSTGALATAAYLFNPLAFALSYTFMTDAYYTGLLIVAVACYTRGLRPDDPSALFLWIGSLASALAYLQRATGALVPLGVVAYLLVARRLRLDGVTVRRVLGVVALPGAAVVASLLAGMSGGAGTTRQLFVQAFLDNDWYGRGLLVTRMSYVVTKYAGLFALPVAVAAVPAARQLAGRASGRGWLVVAATVGVLAGGLAGFSRRLMPSVPQFLGPWGLGPADVLGGRPLLFGNRIAVALTAMCAAAAVIVALALATRVGRGSAVSGAAGVLVAMVAVHAVGAAMLSFLFTETFVSLDRYLLPLVPLVVVLAVWAVGGARLTAPVAWVAVGIFAVAAVVGTRDHLVFQGAVWELAGEVNEAGVDLRQLDAGYSWDGYHLHELSRAEQLTQQTPDGPWWTWDLFAPATDSTFVVAGQPLDGRSVVEVRHYSSWLHRGAVPLYLLVRDGEPD